MTHPMIHRLPVLVAEWGFFVLAYVALSYAFCDFIDGVGGYQVEAVVAAIAAGSGVLVDLLEHVRRRRMVQGRAQTWARRDREVGL